MNLPNKITMLRILMVPVFVFFQFIDNKAGTYTAFAIFIVAASTDWVDGYIARKYNKVTTFGKFADPLADKLLVSCALIGFVSTGEILPVAVMIILCREFIVTTLRVIAISRKVELPASHSAKIKTTTQTVAICILLLNRIHEIAIPLNFIGYNLTLSGIAVLVATLATIYSGVEYIWKNRALLGAA